MLWKWWWEKNKQITSHFQELTNHRQTQQQQPFVTIQNFIDVDKNVVTSQETIIIKFQGHGTYSGVPNKYEY